MYKVVYDCDEYGDHRAHQDTLSDSDEAVFDTEKEARDFAKECTFYYVIEPHDERDEFIAQQELELEKLEQELFNN